MQGFWSRLLDVRHHIAARIFVWVFTCLYAVMVIFMLVFYTMNRSQTKHAMEQTALAMIEQSHTQLQNTLQEVEELSSFLLSDRYVSQYLHGQAEFPPSMEWFDSYNQTLSLMRNYIIGRSRTIVGMGILKEDGERCYTGTIYAPVYTDAPLPYGDQVVIRPSYPYVVRMVPTESSGTAMLFTQLAQDFWQQIYGPGALEQHVICVYGQDGNIIYTSDNYQSHLSQMEDSTRELARSPGVYETREHVLISSREASTGLTATVWISQAYINESLVSFNRQLAALLVILFFTAVLLSRALSLGITRNIKTLKRNAELIGQGRYQETVPVTSSDEIGELGQTMQELSSRIEMLIEDINRREKAKREMELEILRAQVSPHFLYNALNTISYLSTLQGVENIALFSTALIDLLQAALQPTDELISLEQELAYVRSYHEIMRYRRVQDIQLDIDVSPEVHEARIIRMLLQPIVENALIHGIGPQQLDGRICVRVYAQDGDLRIDVTDNGAGMAQEQIDAALSQERNSSPMRFSGIGIRNVLDRVRLQFGEPYGLTIVSVLQVHTTISIRIPLILKEVSHEDIAGG